MTHQKIWPYAEALANMEEIFRLAGNGEPQTISRPDGVTLIIQTQPNEGQIPFVSALSAFEGLPRDTELVIERIKDYPRDLDL